MVPGVHNVVRSVRAWIAYANHSFAINSPCYIDLLIFLELCHLWEGKIQSSLTSSGRGSGARHHQLIYHSGELWLQWLEGPNDSQSYCRGDAWSCCKSRNDPRWMWVWPWRKQRPLCDNVRLFRNSRSCSNTARRRTSRLASCDRGFHPKVTYLRGIASKQLPGNHDRRSPSVLNVAEEHTHDSSAQPEMLNATTAKRTGTTVHNVITRQLDWSPYPQST